MVENATSQAFFEEKYRQSPDPWSFATSPYERNRYAAILRLLNGSALHGSALHGRRFRRCFEPGCSVGVLTEGLSANCDGVEAIDISETAARAAQARCRSLPNVRVAQGALPGSIPQGTFDLIVFSEIGYYFDTPALRLLTADLVERLENSGLLLAAHWLGVSPDHLLSGDQVHQVLAATRGLEHEASERRPGFRIDTWLRT